MNRPLDLSLAAIYYAGFSVLLEGVLLRELLVHGTRESWTVAFFPLAFCVVVALVPAVIGVGLWTLDGAARIAAMIFSFLHMIITVTAMSHLAESKWLLPSLRIVIDVLIIYSLVRPAVRRAFQWQPAKLDLSR